MAEVMLPNSDSYSAVVRSTKAQLLQNVTWIEFYKVRMGYYPIDVQNAVPELLVEPMMSVVPILDRVARDPSQPVLMSTGPREEPLPLLPGMPMMRVPRAVVDATVRTRPLTLFYRRVGEDHYYLRAVGPDGKPFTGDDIYPEIKTEAGSRLGLLISKPEDPSSLQEAAAIESLDGR